MRASTRLRATPRYEGFSKLESRTKVCRLQPEWESHQSTRVSDKLSQIKSRASIAGFSHVESRAGVCGLQRWTKVRGLQPDWEPHMKALARLRQIESCTKVRGLQLGQLWVRVVPRYVSLSKLKIRAKTRELHPAQDQCQSMCDPHFWYVARIYDPTRGHIRIHNWISWLIIIIKHVSYIRVINFHYFIHIHCMGSFCLNTVAGYPQYSVTILTESRKSTMMTFGPL